MDAIGLTIRHLSREAKKSVVTHLRRVVTSDNAIPTKVQYLIRHQ